MTDRIYGGHPHLHGPSGQDFCVRLLTRGHRHSDPTGEPLRDFGEVRDQDHLLEDLPHAQQLLDEEFPRDLRIEGAEVPFVDEQRLHATERAAHLRHRGEFPRDRESKGGIDLRLLPAAELCDVVPLSVDTLDEDADPVASALLVRRQADPTESTVRELGKVLRRLDLQFRQELIDRVHHDAPLVEHAVHEDPVDFEFAAKGLPLPLRLPQFRRVRFEACDLLLQSRRLSFQEVPSLSLRIEFFLESLELRLGGAECLFGRSKSAAFRFERRPFGFEGRPLRREVREPCAHIADLAQQDREFVDPLPFPGLFEDGRADDFQAFLVLLRVWDGMELAQRLDLRIVEGLEEPMAIVGLPSEVVLQLLELPLVFRQHERVLIDRGDFFVDPREGLLRPRLFLTQFPDQVGAVREPFQFPRDPRHAFFQSPFVSEGTERGLPVDVRPERGDLSVQLVDPILRLVASLFVLALREVELPPRRSGRGLPLPVGRLRILEPVHLLPQAIQILDFVLEGGPFRLEPRGDLTLVSDLRLAGLEGFQPVRPILEGRRRPHPSLVLRLEILHFAGAGFEGGLELGDARSALCAVLVQAFQLFLESGEAAERFFPRGDLGLLGLDVALHRRQSFLRSLEGLFEDLKTKELLEHRESLRPAGGPQLLHLLLADEGRVPESVVVETYDVADRPLFVRDRSLDRLAVARELEVRFLLRREAARDFPALVPLPERHTDVTVRPTHVRELHALNVRPRRLAVQGEGDRVQDRRLPRTRAARDHRVFLRKPDRWNRLLEIPHEPAHLDILQDESLRARRGLQIRDRGGFDLRIVPHERASLSTRRASTLIASRFGWSARTLST